MSFEELLNKACESAHLPSTARNLLPRALSDKTKKKLLNLSPEEVGSILNDVIEEINHGAVESIDKLVMKRLEDGKLSSNK